MTNQTHPQEVPELVERLRGLLAKATTLPWQAQQPDTVDVFVPIIGVRLDDQGQPMETPTNGLVGGAMLYPTEIDAEDYERAEANAALMVGAVNALPTLLAALEHQSPSPGGEASIERALVLAMEDFINEPRPGRDEHPDVRDYRHAAYRVWQPLCRAILALNTGSADNARGGAA